VATKLIVPIVLIGLLGTGCGSGGGDTTAASATSESTTTDIETQTAVTTATEGLTPAEAVCAKLTTEALAAASNRVAYLRSLLPQAEEAGLGLAPLIRLATRAVQAGDTEAAAHYFELLDSACQRAG
jgi:hypothetical protein